jgi:hypothetical protein
MIPYVLLREGKIQPEVRSHRRSVEDRGFAVRKNADGPSREVIMTPIKPDFHSSLHVVVRQECSTGSILRLEDVCLENN